MRILITSANSARAHRLKNSLISTDIILGDYHDLPGFMLSTGKMIRLPDPGSAAYIHELLNLCINNDIYLIYVMDIKEVKLLQEAHQLFKEYNIDIQVNDNEI